MKNLPNYKSKEDTVEHIRGFVREHREELPILYRYSPADEYNISALIEGNVYLVSAERMNDANEGKVWHGKRSVGKPRYHFEALGMAENIV